MTTQEPVIVIDKLQKSYGKVQAVRGISMSVERGEIFGFLGPNGAGKTTTIRCMLDVIRPSAGTIRVLGMDAQRDTLALHQRIGYIPGDVRLPGQMTGKQIINYFSRLQGRQPVLLDDLVARFDVEMKRQLKGYSKGMRQKILLIAALFHDPEVLILDEPFSGLDVNAAMILRSLLRAFAGRGKMVLYSSHVLEVVEKVCNKVLILSKGRVVADDSVARLRELNDKSSLEDVFAGLTQTEDADLIARRMLDVVAA